MKKYVILTVLSFLLFSCRSTYYYSTLSTNDEYVENVENGDFLLDTDSLWIAHCFRGEGAPVQITIFNKSNKPLYVDWRKSALIIDDMAMTYSGEQLEYSDSTALFTDSEPYPYGSFSSLTRLPDNVGFIPPQSMISDIPIGLNPNFDKISKKLYKQGIMADKDNNKNKISRIDFDAETSPLLFKSYLTLFHTPEYPMVFEQSFYMSNLIKTHNISPDNLPAGMQERGDLFYIVKHPNTGFAEGLLSATVLVGIVALEVVTSSDYD